MRNLLAALAVVLAFALGALVVWHFTHREAPLPDAPALIVKVREVARLETLDVSLYKKIDFAPDPAATDSTWAAVAQWARHALRPPRGKAIVFADAHLSVDLRKLDERTLRAEGRRVLVVLPEPVARVELKPGETEVIGSNLDSAETAQLLEHAKGAFLRGVEADAGLKERARESARRALRVLLLQLGFAEVQFVPELPRAGSG